MIKFFRKIRQNLLMENKTGKYFKYAIGEIILVVIGILIALQINNWNENRKNSINEKALLANTINDLDADKKRFTNNQKEADTILKVYKKLYELGLDEKSNIEIKNPNYIRRILSFDPNLNKDYSALSNRISDDDIRESILSYDLKLNIFEVSFIEFRKIIEDRIRVFLGEKGLYKLESLYKNNSNFIDVNELIDLAKTNQFQQLLFEAKLKLENLNSLLIDIINKNEELKHTINNQLKK